MKVGRSHNTVMGRRVALGELVTEINAAGFPINEKLALLGAVLDPIEAHIDGFGSFLIYCAVCKTFRGRVVDAAALVATISLAKNPLTLPSHLSRTPLLTSLSTPSPRSSTT